MTRFVVPPEGRIRSQYTTSAVLFKDGPTRKLLVEVNRVTDDGNVVIGEYVRSNAYMDETFEPFRQLKDGVWKDYALVSSGVDVLEVMDLTSGEIIAVAPQTVFTDDMRDTLTTEQLKFNTLKVGDVVGKKRLRVHSFYVPDWWGHFFGEDAEETVVNSKGEEVYRYPLNELMDVTGQWGFCSVFVGWSENYPALRYVDLSRISEGVVEVDDRFGDLEVYSDLRSMTFYPGEDTLTVPTKVTVALSSGAVVSSRE